VDRLIYGRRPDPVTALAHLGDLVADAHESELLALALGSVAESVGAAGAAVVAHDGRVVGRAGTHPAGYQIGLLRFGGQNLGSLQLATRYTPPAFRGEAERRLHAALTSQVAVVVRAIELAEDVKAERDRVIAATRDERERLRRDLHDGLGPSLSGVGLGLQALADTMATRNVAASAALLDRISAEVVTAVRDIRRIIDDLRPTALDHLNLVGAVRRFAATLSIAVTTHVGTDDLGRLTPDVETAAYRIITEALTNTTRHANASCVHVTMTADGGSLQITIADDGDGGASSGTPGIGLASMRRRAEVLGGSLTIGSGTDGTTVTATLPLEKP
jgi:signal transduction histidine kinase